jgi:hypothetical protein
MAPVPLPVAQDHLATIRKGMGAVLRRHGFRVDSKRSWRRGDDEDGYVVVAWLGDRWNTKEAAEASVHAAVWPPGTREHLTRLWGSEVEPFVAVNAPVFGAGDAVVGDPSADTFAVTATTAEGEVAELVTRAQAYAETLVAWAELMLDARASAPSMHDQHAVAALMARHPDWPGLDTVLDRLTAAFQRDPRPIELHPVIREWRRERGLPDVPLPAWSRYASRPYGNRPCDSPRAELLAGLGTGVEFRHADGTVRLPQPEDLPDAVRIARWREEARRSPLPDGVLHELPEWLPYAAWLDEPGASAESEAPVPTGPTPSSRGRLRRWMGR